MLSAFVGDGYEEPGFIAAVENLHPELTFTFRPLTAEELGDHTASTAHADERGKRKVVADKLAKKLVSWSLVDQHNNPVSVSAENMLKLKPRVFARLFEIVWGYDAPETQAKREGDVKN